MERLKTLRTIIGQEAGIVITDGEAIIGNFSSFEGLPKVFAGVLVDYGSLQDCQVVDVREVTDISQALEGLLVVYDENQDYDNLKDAPGVVYDLSNGAQVIAPDGWN
jgi:hypothetical protein